MEREEKKCMMCGKALTVSGGICAPCRDRVRRGALGEQAATRVQAEQELKRHGVTPPPAVAKKN